VCDIAAIVLGANLLLVWVDLMATVLVLSSIPFLSLKSVNVSFLTVNCLN